jgi:cytochrome P460
MPKLVLVAFPDLWGKLIIYGTHCEEEPMKKLAGIVLVWLIFSSVITALAGEESLPKDLDSYTYTGSLAIPDKDSPLFGFFHYYINKKGLEAFKKGGPYPDDTIIVGKVYEVVTSPIVGIIEGKLMRYSYMKKNISAKETGGWIFAVFSRDGKLIQKDVKTACFACHMAAKESDYVFSKPLE